MIVYYRKKNNSTEILACCSKCGKPMISHEIPSCDDNAIRDHMLSKTHKDETDYCSKCGRTLCIKEYYPMPDLKQI